VRRRAPARRPADFHAVERIAAAELADRIERADFLHPLVFEMDADRRFGIGREDVEGAAAKRIFAGLVDPVVGEIAEGVERGGERLAIHGIADADAERLVRKSGGRSDELGGGGGIGDEQHPPSLLPAWPAPPAPRPAARPRRVRRAPLRREARRRAGTKEPAHR
jgi:hypothetical protein